MPTTISGTSGVSQCAPGSVSKDDFGAGVLVGTVSQVGGLPTGAIIQRDSNANGQYVRYADGTQICWQAFNFGTVAFSAGSGTLYYTSLPSLTFPVPFIASPTVHMDVLSGPGLVWTSQGSNFPTPTGTAICYALSPTTGSIALTGTYIAIGRWF